MWVLPFFVSGVSSCPALAGAMNVCRYPPRVSVFPEENAGGFEGWLQHFLVLLLV